MTEEVTYLELAEPGAVVRFYEVIVHGPELRVRFGRAGQAGQRTLSLLISEEAARAEAHKKIDERLRKGYQRRP